MIREKLSSSMSHEAYDDLLATEIVSERSACGAVFTVGAGRYQAFVASEPIHEQDAATGAWLPIDRTPRTDAETREKLSQVKNRLSLENMKEETSISEAAVQALGNLHLINRAIMQSVSMDTRVGYGVSGLGGFLERTGKDGKTVSWGLQQCAVVIPAAEEMGGMPGSWEEEKGAGMTLRQLREQKLSRLQGTVLYKEILPGIDLHIDVGQQTLLRFEYKSADALQPIVLTRTNGTLSEVSSASAENRRETAALPPEQAIMEISSATGEPLTKALSISSQLIIEPDSEIVDSVTYPLTVTLALGSSTQTTAIETTYVSSKNTGTNYSTSNIAWVSRSSTSYGERITYMRVTALPAIKSSHFLTGAYLYVSNHYAQSSDTALLANKVTSVWTCSSVTYANRPSHESLYLDYALVKANANKTYAIDVTEPAVQWYHTGVNHGICFTPFTSNPNVVVLVSSANTSSNKKPYFVLNYASLAGIENYYIYDQQTAGRAGGGFVGLHNGNLIFAHTDTEMNGLRMPVSVTHYYNQCEANTNTFFMGYGWRTSLHQTLHAELQNDQKVYVYADGDGTEHWFEPQGTSTTTYQDTSGLNMTLTVGSNNITIRDKGDNVMTFPLVPGTPTASTPTAKVLITKLTDANGNAITITANGMKITKVTDGAGREINFAYTGSLCTAIYPPWCTAANGTRFAYDTNSRLTQITYEDDKSSSYTYSAQNGYALLNTATGPEGITATYTYHYEDASFGLKHFIASAKVTGGSLTSSHVHYTYGNHVTRVKDQLTSKTLRYHFNDNGNNISADDELGYAVYTEYDQSGSNANTPINHATLRSRMQRVVTNLLVDGSQELGNNAWVTANEVGSGSVMRAQGVYRYGLVSRKITISGGGRSVCKQTVTAVSAGSSYTLSCFVRSDGPKAYLRAEYTVGGSTVTVKSDPAAPVSDEKFHRISVSFTLPSNAAASVTCAMVAETTAGSAYFDCMQLESGLTCNSYNLIENSDFRNGGSVLPDNWEKDSSVSNNFVATLALPGTAPSHLSGRMLQLKGQYNRSVVVYQGIRAYGNAGDRFTLGGWCSSWSKKNNADSNIRCRIYAYFHVNTSGASTYGGCAEWNAEEGEWQFACGNIVAPADYSKITLYIQMIKQMNLANFTGLFLYPEQFGAEYVYDAKGNRKDARRLFGQSEKQTYDAQNNPITHTAPGRTVSTTFSWGDTVAQRKKHLLLKSISPLGTVSAYVYNSHGLPTQQETQNSDNTLFIRSATAYTATGNYAASQTDSRGKVTTTVTDASKGTVTSVTDPKGQTVAYTYDTLRRVKSVTADNGGPVKNEYAYHADKGTLTTLKHNTTTDTSDVTYTFGYDALCRPTTVKVGGATLSTNTYTNSGIHTGTLASVTYGNGFKVTNTYDTFNRLKAVKYGTATRFSYAYNAAGRVAWVRDHESGQVTESEYDLSGRPCRKKTHDGSGHLYTGEVDYDATTGLLSVFREYVGTGYTAYQTTFGYDNENRPKTLNYGNTSNQSVVTYDALGRISKRTVKVEGASYATSYAFVAGGHGTGSTTPLISKMTQTGETCAYTYDDVGNITAVTRNGVKTTYKYDNLGQLIRVNDPGDTTSGDTGTTWTYEYDRGGNLLNKKRYAYTTATSPGTALQTIAYVYGDTAWKDKLTGFNNWDITYDAIGNPVTYGNWTYTWENGRQLKKLVHANGVMIENTYNADGLRVAKKLTSTSGNVSTTKYSYHGKNLVHLVKGSKYMHFWYDAQNRPAIVNYSGTKYAYIYNLQGDVLGLIDSTGEEVVRYTYDAWGKVLSTTGALASTLGALNPFRYRGYIYDTESLLYYLRTRFYSPNWQRFLNADTLFDSNQFTYCFNNPTTFFDENGELAQAVMHAAVCNAIVMKYPNLHKTGVKILNIIGKKYGLADIRSDDGMVWEVKRVTCSSRKASLQLAGYLSGNWSDEKSPYYGLNPKRGDNRPIHGLVTNVPGFLGFYFNVGNGFILYDYIEQKQTKQLTSDTLEEEMKEKIRKRAPAFNPVPVPTEESSSSGAGAAIFGTSVLMGIPFLLGDRNDPWTAMTR